MLKILAKITLPLLALIVASGSIAQQQILDIKNSWIRQMPPGAPTLAAYMTITNAAKNEVTIKSVSSTVSKIAEIHDVEMENDMMKMRKLSELTIAPGQSIEFKPGSMHLMLINVEKSLREGDEVELEFELQDLPPVTTVVSVRKEP